ncbi:uncharacterized protein ARMOST_06318 [Armillaria ostoyae]|uniref:Uncharacterized protein n=1 Tax=Armillaria ostoyae TaxID=47428 RepID=A0A284R2R1_ARMOS|nr:uncharacterized protein ARMOST_06318 [Armillaria ostoyae]
MHANHDMDLSFGIDARILEVKSKISMSRTDESPYPDCPREFLCSPLELPNLPHALQTVINLFKEYCSLTCAVISVLGLDSRDAPPIVNFVTGLSDHRFLGSITRHFLKYNLALGPKNSPTMHGSLQLFSSKYPALGNYL